MTLPRPGSKVLRRFAAVLLFALALVPALAGAHAHEAGAARPADHCAVCVSASHAVADIAVEELVPIFSATLTAFAASPVLEGRLAAPAATGRAPPCSDTTESRH